jgi:hypothetical protein
MNNTGRKKCLQPPGITCMLMIFVLMLCMGISAQDKKVVFDF